MAVNYHVVVRHVSYWRGNPHRWSTVYPYVSTASGVSMTEGLLDDLANLDLELCYNGPGDAQGCVYRTDFYNADVGGMPVLSSVHGAGETVDDGLPFQGTVWGTDTQPKETTLETALLLKWGGGISKSGKPVYFKKFIHAVPSSLSTDGDPDVPGVANTNIVNVMLSMRNLYVSQNLAMGNTRRLADSQVPDRFYCNHQMPRGRRHKKITSTSYKPGTYITISPPTD